MLHGLMLLFLILFPLLAPQTLKNYRLTMLAPPTPPQQEIEPLQVKLPPPPRPAFQPIKEEPKLIAETLPVPPPKPAPAAPEVRLIPQPAAPAPPASVNSTILDPKPVAVTPPMQPPVVTNVFSTTVSNPAVTVPVRNTEASGFGDTGNNREPARTTRGEGAAVAGFGEVKGVRGSGGTGPARSAGTLGGFDVGAAGGSPGGSGRGAVLSAGFTSAADAPKPTAPTVKPGPSRNEKPVEIMFKPRPDYTDEARKMRIEGEVLLRVLFASTGEAHVLETIRGLGFGLNENAIRSAEQIRFKPAQRAGQPVDSTAIVHIVFQLAY